MNQVIRRLGGIQILVFLGLTLGAGQTLAKETATEVKADKSTKKVEKKENHLTVVEMKTNHGMIHIELDEGKAPITVRNFLSYVDDKFYDGTIFHRVIDKFMIQGGGFIVKGDKLEQKSTKAPIKNEGKNGLKNVRGSIAMARTNIPDSATAQFFINVADNPGLDYPSPDGHGYAVFGKVVKGMDVVDKIKAVRTGSRSGMGDVPVENVVIESVRRLESGSKKS